MAHFLRTLDVLNTKNMKKMIFILLALSGVQGMQSQSNSGSAAASATEPAVSGTVMPLTNDIPDPVTKSFKRDYPAYKPVWSKEGYNYRADYMDQSQMGGMVVYDKGGRILRSETELQANSYPGSIGDYHTSNLPQRKYKVYSTRDTIGNKTYYSTTDDEMLMFDQEGNYKSRTSKKGPSRETKK